MANSLSFFEVEVFRAQQSQLGPCGASIQRLVSLVARNGALETRVVGYVSQTTAFNSYKFEL